MVYPGTLQAWCQGVCLTARVQCLQQHKAPCHACSKSYSPGLLHSHCLYNAMVQCRGTELNRKQVRDAARIYKPNNKTVKIRKTVCTEFAR